MKIKLLSFLTVSGLAVSQLIYGSSLSITASDTPVDWATAAWDVAPDATQEVTVTTSGGVTGSPLEVTTNAEARRLILSTGPTLFEVAHGATLSIEDTALSAVGNSFRILNGASATIAGTLNMGAYDNIEVNNTNSLLTITGTVNMSANRSINIANNGSRLVIDGGTYVGAFSNSYNVEIKNNSTVTSSGSRELFNMAAGARIVIDNSLISAQRSDTTPTGDQAWSRTMFMTGNGASFTLQNGSVYNGSNYDFDNPDAVAINNLSGHNEGALIGNSAITGGNILLFEVLSGSKYSSKIVNLGMNAPGHANSDGTARMRIAGTAGNVSEVAVQTMYIKGSTVANSYAGEMLLEGFTNSVFNNLFIGNESSAGMASTADLKIYGTNNTVKVAADLKIYLSRFDGSTHTNTLDIAGSNNAVTVNDLYVGGDLTNSSTNMKSGTANANLGGTQNALTARDIYVRASLESNAATNSAFNVNGSSNNLVITRNLNIGSDANSKSGTAIFEVSGNNNNIVNTLDPSTTDTSKFTTNIGAVSLEAGSSVGMLVSGNENNIRSTINVISSTAGDAVSSLKVTGSKNTIIGYNSNQAIGAAGGSGSAVVDLQGSGNIFGGLNLNIGSADATGSGNAYVKSSSSSGTDLNTLHFMNVNIATSTTSASTLTNSLILAGNTQLIQGGGITTGDSRMRIYVGTDGSLSGAAEFLITGKNNTVVSTQLVVGQSNMDGTSSAKMLVEGSTHSISVNWGNNNALSVGTKGTLSFVADADGFSTIAVTGYTLFEGTLELDFSNIAITDASGVYSTTLISSSQTNSAWEDFCNALVLAGESAANLTLIKQNAADSLVFAYENGSLNIAYTGTVVPEPGTYAAIFGAIALAFSAYRRRK